MARDTTSDWRLNARLVINRTLNELPPDTPDKAVRRAVSDAYPWGERSGWPYTCWLREVRAALGPSRTPPDPADPCYVLDQVPIPWYVRVICDHCDDSRRRSGYGTTRGCLLCGPLVDALDGLLASPEFIGLLSRCLATPADPLPRGVLADWLDEHGHDALASLFRASMGASP